MYRKLRQQQHAARRKSGGKVFKKLSMVTQIQWRLGIFAINQKKCFDTIVGLNTNHVKTNKRPEWRGQELDSSVSSGKKLYARHAVSSAFHSESISLTTLNQHNLTGNLKKKYNL